MTLGTAILIGAVLVLFGFALIGRAREGRDLMAPPAPRPIVPRLVPSSQSTQTTLSPDSQSAVVAALRAGNKFEAIKLYRDATGADLIASKDAVEAMQD